MRLLNFMVVKIGEKIDSVKVFIIKNISGAK